MSVVTTKSRIEECESFLRAALGRADELKTERDRYRAALETLADPRGGFGPSAKIARAALALPVAANASEPHSCPDPDAPPGHACEQRPPEMDE